MKKRAKLSIWKIANSEIKTSVGVVLGTYKLNRYYINVGGGNVRYGILFHSYWNCVCECIVKMMCALIECSPFTSTLEYGFTIYKLRSRVETLPTKHSIPYIITDTVHHHYTHKDNI